MVYRVFVEKKEGLAPEAASLRSDCVDFLGIKSLEKVRILNRYDVEDIPEELFEQACRTIFSEPPIDIITFETDTQSADVVFAVEALPGQFDQRADSAAQCLQMLAQGERPLVASAKVYCLYGQLSEEDIAAVKHYVINPVETREASLEKPETLKREYPVPADVAVLEGFRERNEEELKETLKDLGLAMDLNDLKLLQKYFREEEERDPTLTEIRVVDTYWSDHCRHTTFSTEIEDVEISDRMVGTAYGRYETLREEVYGERAATRPETLMDLATIGAKALKKRGLTPEIDESEEINACSIRVPAEVDGKNEDWLLMFKNETHNHPTEIEPFGGAATCIGGCIRDPLSGRVYVHQAMRFTGGGDPRATLKDTLPGKLPQRKIAQTAAAGYSSYGNQIGLATGHVAEVYHEGYVAKRLECGAVVGAAPADHVVRMRPQPGDVIILLGGRTGRDGIGGATGSSKSHDLKSLQTMASEVQKGNAPEERKIQRLFRNGEVTRMIKRCNDFGAGGVSVAIGELADGLIIDLDKVRKKYEGLDGTELAISESQERMAVVVAAEDEEKFIAAAARENLEAYRVAVVTEEKRILMNWRGKTILNISRDFLNTNGAPKHTSVEVTAKDRSAINKLPFSSLQEMASSLKCADQRGLRERFDGTVGAGSLLMPYGGKRQRTPAQAMAALFPVRPDQHTSQGSLMAWGCDPDQMSVDPYLGAYNAVYTSVAKLIAGGADYQKAYLTLQEFFEKLHEDPQRWGKPFSALLGALDAQIELETAAIGGKDSMSGSFLDKDVPPTLISFAIAPVKAEELITAEFKGASHPVVLFDGNTPEEMKDAWQQFRALRHDGKVLAAWAVENGIAEGLFRMAQGNGLGVKVTDEDADLYCRMPGALLAELSEECAGTRKIAETLEKPILNFPNETVSLKKLEELNDAVLAKVYPYTAETSGACEDFSFHAEEKVLCPAEYRCERPKALIPAFPGTNSEIDTQRALLEAGADAEIVVIRNLTAKDVADSVAEFAEKLKTAQIVVIPGGFSGGDEPDGSAKFITAFFRNPAVKEATEELLQVRKGLILGICNGFQALIKLGLVPYGRILEQDEAAPTLTYNVIGRHQSKIVATRVVSDRSPWLAETKPGDVYQVAISHGEGRFLASEELVKELAKNGQIATQYADSEGHASLSCEYNPNGSVYAVEGITSPDGRVFGKMGHVERIGKDLYRNVPGNYEMGLFRSAVRYFRGE